MPRYIKLLLDNRRRQQYSEKARRSNRLTMHLSNIVLKEQTRLFKAYCQSTTASHSVYSQFALSRHSLRKHANFGLVSGVKPSSW